MRTLICSAATISLVLAGSISAGYANAKSEGNPHIDRAVQYSPSPWRTVRHTIRLHTP